MVAVLSLREIDRGFRVTVGSTQTLKLVHVFTASQVGLKSKDSTFACTYSYCDWILITPTYNRRCSIIGSLYERKKKKYAYCIPEYEQQTTPVTNISITFSKKINNAVNGLKY